jgi:hypothetical protein
MHNIASDSGVVTVWEIHRWYGQVLGGGLFQRFNSLCRTSPHKQIHRVEQIEFAFG